VAADRGLLSIANPMSSDLNPQKSWILAANRRPGFIARRTSL